MIAWVLRTFYFLCHEHCTFCLFFLQGMPGGHGKKGEMGRPVKFSLNILHNFHIFNNAEGVVSLSFGSKQRCKESYA